MEPWVRELVALAVSMSGLLANRLDNGVAGKIGDDDVCRPSLTHALQRSGERRGKSRSWMQLLSTRGRALLEEETVKEREIAEARTFPTQMDRKLIKNKCI